VLGVTKGNATILVGEEGERLELQEGDVIVLSAGTGVESSDDFEGVGGDPGGMYYNSRTWDPEERNQAVSEVGHVPIPETDPVFGNTDPMLDKWKK